MVVIVRIDLCLNFEPLKHTSDFYSCHSCPRNIFVDEKEERSTRQHPLGHCKVVRKLDTVSISNHLSKFRHQGVLNGFDAFMLICEFNGKVHMCLLFSHPQNLQIS